MKRTVLFLTFLSFMLIPLIANAQEKKAPLGIGNIAVKVDYIKFTDSNVRDFDTDKGVLFALEAYHSISSNLYLGGEIGYTNIDGSVTVSGVKVDTELTFMPIELNVKYAGEIANNLSLDIGGGISYNHAEVEASVNVGSLRLSAKDDKWLLGGQGFLDLNYALSNKLFVGLNGKYQIGEKMLDTKLNNYRLGGQIGIKF